MAWAHNDPLARSAVLRHKAYSPTAIAVMFFAGIDLIGIALGVAGLLDKTSKKVFPILGLTVGVGELLLVAILTAIGLSMKG